MSNITKADMMRRQLQQMEGQFKMALPAHVKPEKFVRVVQTVVLSNPKLLSADPKKLFAACIKSAELGLMPNGKEAALIPYGDDVQFQPMYEGLLKLVRNSGELESITSKIVFKGEKFEYYVDQDGEHFRHEPDPFNQSDEIVGAYCMAKTKDGGVYLEFMSPKEIKAVENVSRSKSGPWSGPFRNEMIKKSVFKRLYKRLPKSTDIDFDDVSDFDKAVQADPAPEFSNEPQEPKKNVAVDTKPKAKEAKNLKEKLKEQVNQNTGEIIDAESKEVKEPDPEDDII